ncbi:MAG: head GIN domain-containing protein [Lutimonas sp.]
MKQSIAILILITLFMSCTSDDEINGSGNLITESRDVDAFSKVSSEGVFEVVITQGSPQSVEITADDNIMNKVKTRVISDELQLYLDDDYNYSGITLQAKISAEALNGIMNSGVGDMEISNVNENGAFSIDNFGTGNITIEGSAASLNVVSEGTGNILAFDFFVEDCSIDILGTGFVQTNCSDNLDITIEGSGDVYYKGNPTINTSITGSGSVIDAN